MKRILLLAAILLGLFRSNYAQNVFDPNDPIVRYSSSAAYGSAQKPDSTIPGLRKWVANLTNGISSGTGAFKTLSETYKSYIMNAGSTILTFRLKFPKSYTNPDSVNKKYPIALFLHGAGEVACPSNGGIYNNEKQLALGGQLFAQRVDNNQFDGFLLYPSLRSKDGGCWGEWGGVPNANYNVIMTIIDSMVKYIRADNDRVFVFGLSGGGVGTWRIAEAHPTRIARIAPTSAAGFPMPWASIVHIPVWLATGGKDTNPSPTMAEYSETKFKEAGGNIRRDLYEDLGHASWYRHWEQPDFVKFMNETHKANPLIYFNRFEFCPTDAVNAKIGITAGFYAYEWQKDGNTIATRTGNTNNVIDPSSIILFEGNDITVKAFGTYRVRFQRVNGGPWSDWSLKPAVISPKAVTQTPPIVIAGTRSKVLPAPDGSTTVPLQLPPNFQNYQWVRTTDNVVVSTAQNFVAPVGSYKARYTEPYGCGTEYSPVFKVVAANGTPKPDAAKNLAVSAISQTALRLDWSDNPNAGTNETGFEIYRAAKAGGPYTLVFVTAPNVVTYQDNNLTPNTTYYYLVRAISETGAAANSNEASEKTEIDNIAPSAPLNLEYRGSTSTTVNLRWKAASDNVGISRYDIYANGQKLYSSEGLSFTVGNLDSLTNYTFVVKAVDKAGNESNSSNQVIAYTHRQGLKYKYYHGTYSNLPNFSNLTPVLTGITDTVNAGIGIRTRDDNFAFLWEGKIYIPAAGTYTFETYSDDGSKLYIDVPYSNGATALVNNDGAHSAQYKTGSKYLTAGYHTIAITYAEVSGGEEMSLYWSNNVGLERERIPKNFFSIGDEFSGSSLQAPSLITATAVAYNKINLTWADNSSNETGFEIVRSTSLNGTYVPVTTTAANATAYTDSGLTANTKYYYKIRAIGNTGESEFAASLVEANWRFNNDYSEANGGPAASASNTAFSNSDKAEGSHAVVFTNNDYISIGGNSTTFPSMGGYSQRTVALWIKPSSTANKRMIFEIGGADNGLGLRISSSGLLGSSNDLVAGVASGSSRSTISLTNFPNNANWLAGQWNHVAVVYNSNTLTLYLNGVQVASTNSLSFTSIGNSSSSSRLGAPSGTGSDNVFNDGSALTGSYSTYLGSMDNMFIIKAALSQADIVQLKNTHNYPQSFATTLAAPVAPNAPSNLTANVLSTSAIALKFNDNSSDETGFEIWRASGDKSNNRKIASIPAGNTSQITFVDTTLFANITYYYKVRATGVTSNSAYSNEANGKTLNTNPVINQVRDFTMKYGTTFVLPVKATDADGEVLTFTTANLPTFATTQDVENGLMNISFSPSITKRGTYSMTVYVQDGNGGKDSTFFRLTVNTNDIPVLADVAETLTVNEGAQINLPVSATDNNGTSLMTWDFDGLPSFATFTNNNDGTGNILFKPGYSAAGDYPITIYVNDGYGAWTSRSTVLTVVNKEPESTLQFDFKVSTVDSLPGWNNIRLTPPTFSHGIIVDTKNNVSPVTVTLVKGAITSSTQGPQSGTNTGAMPNLVMKDIMLWGFWAGNHLSDTVVIKVAGLDTDKTYDFTFHSGYNLNGIATSTTTFKIGNQASSVTYYQNATANAVITGAVPNGAGEILVTMIGDPNFDRGGMVSGMIIKSNYDDGSTPAKPGNLTGIHSQNEGVKLTWTDRAFNENAYYVYRSTAKAGPYTLLNNGASNRDSTRYFDIAVAPETQYYYYVAGINAVGIGASSDTIKVVTGNNTPVITIQNAIYLKAQSSTNIDFTATDDATDVVTVSLQGKPSFITLQNLGGGNYRLVANPLTDHIGWFNLIVKAADNKGAIATKIIPISVADKNTRSVFINFGSADKTAAAPWNNWLGPKAAGNTLANLKDETNTATPFSITTTSSWATTFDMGHMTGNNSGVYPDSVLQSGVYDGGGPRTVTFNGLDNTKKYNIVIVGSMNEGLNATVEYTSGTTKDTLNARYNTNQTANLNGLTPSGGTISFSALRIGGSLISYLNAIVLEEYNPSSVTILNPLNLYAEPYDRNNIDLSWSDRTVEEDAFGGYVLERANDSLFTVNVVTIALPANTSTYRYTGLTANTKYWFRLRAKTPGGLFSDYSNRAKAITPASVVSVNFNYTMPDADYPWNNTFASPSITGVFDNLINQSGAISGLSIELIKIFNGEFTAGVNTGNNSGVVPDKVLASNYWLDNTQICQYKLSGMNHSRRYRIGFIGSSSNVGWFKGNYTATYTINGRTVYLNSWMNSSKVVYIDNVEPDATGSVYLDFSTTAAAQYGFNAGVIVQDYTDPDAISSGTISSGSFLETAPGLEVEETADEALAARASSVTKTRLYPNPFTDFINMDFHNTSASNNVSVEVYDLSGRLSYRKIFGKMPAGANTLRIGTTDAGMTTGVYIITLSMNGKPIKANKVIRTTK